jgi:hypothetical protein
MRGIQTVFILILVLIAPAQCQQTANSATISGFDLDNSAQYNKALNTALNFYNQLKYDEAINAYDAAIRLDPNSTQTWQAWNGKGDALYGLGKFDEAVLAYDKAIELWPNNAIPWAYKGDALKALGQINDSEAAYARSKELGFGGSTWRPSTITLNGQPIAIPDTNSTTSIDEEMRSLLNTRTSPTVEPVNHILDHSMASVVDESTNIPITRTYKFTNADRKAYSWLRLADVAAGKVEWYWYSPDGNLYKTGSVEVPPNPNGGYWPSYNIWYYIDIADIPVEPYLSGRWNVNVYLVGPTYVTQLTEHFDLDNGLLPQKNSSILDHCTASSIDEAASVPIGRKDRFFLTTDSKIYSWISLGNVGPASFYWYWYSPDGSSYRVGPIDIPPNPSGGYWPTYNLWTSIDARTLYGETWDLELSSDEFHVDVIRNDRQILTEYFTIDE